MPRRGPSRRAGVSPAQQRKASRKVQKHVDKRQRQNRRKRRRRVLAGGAVIVGGGALAYKLTHKQTEQIEAATGVPVDEMSDEEIQGAMDQLGIQGEPLTAEEQAQAAAQPPEATAADAPAEPDYIAQLTQLAALRDQGILTEDEFEAKKKQILGI